MGIIAALLTNLIMVDREIEGKAAEKKEKCFMRDDPSGRTGF
jgi:hypothetical protein